MADGSRNKNPEGVGERGERERNRDGEITDYYEDPGKLHLHSDELRVFLTRILKQREDFLSARSEK